MYKGDPQSVSAKLCGSINRANPKSAIFNTAFSSLEFKSRFCGFKSRWIMFFDRRNLSPEARVIVESITIRYIFCGIDWKDEIDGIRII